MKRGVLLFLVLFLCVSAVGCVKMPEVLSAVKKQWENNTKKGKYDGQADNKTVKKDCVLNREWTELKDVIQKYREAGDEEWKILDGSSELVNPDGLFLYTGEKPYYLKYRCYTEKNGWLDYVSSMEKGKYDYAGLPGEIISDIDIEVWDHEGKVDHKYIVLYRIKRANEWSVWKSSGTNILTQQARTEIKTNVENEGVTSCICGIEIKVFEKRYERIIPDQSAKIIDAPYIYQNYKYPNGCESVSAVMALNYWGIEISVDDFINKYLARGNKPIVNGIGPDPDLVYCGNPRSSSGWGCNFPVIAKAMKKIVSKLGFDIYGCYGKTMAELCDEYIDKDIPVIIWATVEMIDSSGDSFYAEWVTENGKIIRYNRKLHCLLLVGYDSEYYYFNDPMVMHASGAKYTGYKKTAVEKAYDLLGKQSVAMVKR